jgi:3-oxoacyl-(acyl-carrier-protein) synthase
MICLRKHVEEEGKKRKKKKYDIAYRKYIRRSALSKISAWLNERRRKKSGIVMSVSGASAAAQTIWRVGLVGKGEYGGKISCQNVC